MATTAARRLFTIQYLRAVSAIAIVLFHAGAHYKVGIPIGEGRIALFFIVSGFIFWWITAGRVTRPDDFLLRRIARLVPLYWLVTLTLFIAAALGLSTHARASGSSLIQSLLFIPHLNARGQILPILVPGWTLVYEAFFCVIFAALLYIEEARRLWTLTLLFGGLAVCGFLFRPTNPIASTYTDQILLEFIAGAWLAHLWPRFRLSQPVALGLLVAGLIISLVPVPAWSSGFPAATSGIPAIMMVIGAIGLEPPGGRRIGWLARIGDSSYSIYLWHIPALIAFAALFRALGLTSAPWLIGATTAAGVILGLILYEWLEKPLTNWLFACLDSRDRRATRYAVSKASKAN